jgi:hypothetical protein
MLSCLPDRKTETCGSKVVAGIKQESSAAVIEDARVLDHVGVPPIGRHIDAFISSEPSPGKSFFGYSMMNAILRTSAAEPHSVAVGIFHDAWLADRILVGRGRIDDDPIKLLQCTASDDSAYLMTCNISFLSGPQRRFEPATSDIGPGRISPTDRRL